MIRALIRRLRTRLRRDVRYDLLDDLVEALDIQGEIEMQREMEEEIESHREYVRAGGCTDLFDSQCVACGCQGVWSIRSSICPSCASGGREDSAA